MSVQGAEARVFEVLRRSPLFSTLDPRILHDIASSFRLVPVTAGSICCQEGDPGTEMFVVERGQFAVTGRVGEQIVQFAELGPGAIFGEMAVVTGQPRSATVRATTDALIWALQRQELMRLVQRHPDLGRTLARLASERIQSRKQQPVSNEKQVLVSLESARQSVVIGRSEGADIFVDNPTVSRRHALVECDERGCRITDLNSYNGTYVNGERVTTKALVDGDQIVIGNSVIYFDRSALSEFSRGSGVKVDCVDLERAVNEKLKILNGVSLSIYPGELVCIVGGSGAGKSTLLNALNGFRPATSGRVLYNGVDYYDHLDQFRQGLGYVPQDDIIHPELTVEQTLYYAARLRLPRDTSGDEISRRIENVLKTLELTERRNTEVRQLSGGQRKRVSIAVELLTEPGVFYLDEPTSGLDPGLDGRMMEMLRKLADEGRTVILTTHATRNIMLADKVIFMGRGGHLAFFGSPREALTFFGVEDFTEIYHLLEDNQSIANWKENYRQSELFQRNVTQRLEGQSLATAGARRSQTALRSSSSVMDWPSQMFWLAARYMRILARDRVALGVLLAAAPIIALTMTQTFPGDLFAMSFEDGGDARTGVALLFMLSTSSIFLGGFVAARSIAEETAIYARERLINLALFPYVASKVCVLGIFSVVQSALLIAIVAQKVDFPGGNETVLKLAAILILTNLIAVGMGLLVSGLSGNGLQATLIIVILLIPQLSLAGAVVPLSQVSKIARYLSDTMISRWSISLLGHTVDLNARLDVQAPQNPFRDQFDIDPTRYALILGGLFLIFFVGTIVALKMRDTR
ncbi:MAG TPA: ATP-binding cassette domain-containing protein [Chloroflexota bacterium]|nr:ATP-binding cassette domain-containing protein [Chloroflexota bacterium]